MDNGRDAGAQCARGTGGSSPRLVTIANNSIYPGFVEFGTVTVRGIEIANRMGSKIESLDLNQSKSSSESREVARIERLAQAGKKAPEDASTRQKPLLGSSLRTARTIKARSTCRIWKFGVWKAYTLDSA
ncbi:hypothetical protein EVAR_22180_1 [Eumeta japonica]|uniref:Uncharacterized protein n=1 Tax=Eumeta variegata TaxID=151549 RepID=A0A4C1XW21_EUMVA|nr:hypothetical protein EVAR_22180_1 [Eumeta japonica]